MNKNNPKYIVVHCSDVSYKTSTDQLNSINTYHRDQRAFPKSSLGFYVGYHKLITNGKVNQTRLDTDEGGHCNQFKDGVSMNFQSLGICIAFDGDVEIPTPADSTMLRDEIWAWQDKYNIPTEKILFHRDMQPAKTCPGNLITRLWLEQMLFRVVKTPVKEVVKSELMVDKEQVLWLVALLRKYGFIK